MIAHRYIAAIALAATLASPPAGAGSFFVSSPPGTSTVDIEPGSPYAWTITAGGDYSALKGGVFALRYQPGTTNGLRLQVEDLVNGGFLPGENDSLTAAEFNAQAGGNGDSLFSRIVIDFTGSINLSSSDNYRITLSVTGEPGAGIYTMRGNFDPESNPFVATSDPEMVVVSADSGSPPVSTPEPAAALLLVGALLGLAVARRPSHEPPDSMIP